MNARNFIEQLMTAVGRLRLLPESGWVVAEFNEPSVREIVYGNYRIIYRYRQRRVQILAVVHGARLLHNDVVERN